MKSPLGPPMTLGNAAAACLFRVRWNPNDTAVLADLGPGLHGLPLGIPLGVLGEVKTKVPPIQRSGR